MHDCSKCGCACYCHGDIDDCSVEDPAYAYAACDGCGCDEDEDWEYDDYWDAAEDVDHCRHCGAKYDGGHHCGTCGHGDPLCTGEFDPVTGEQP